jgi:hypothetical protein
MGSRSVSQVCEDCLDHEELLKGCNLFVQSVCGNFGYGDLFSKGDNADAMIAKFSKTPFQWIGKDPDKATACANAGSLVLGGLTKAGMSYDNKLGVKIEASMGHVVVIAPGGPSNAGKLKLANGQMQDMRGGYPYCYGGAAIPKYRIKSRLQVDAVFPSVVLRDVVYAYLDVVASK